MVKFKNKVGLLLLCVFLFVNGCGIVKVQTHEGNVEEDKQLTEREIQLFHDNWNKEKYADIYNNAAPQFQKAQDKEQLLSVIKQGRKEFGEFKNVKDKRINVIIGAPVQIRVVYISQFDTGEVTEMFNYIRMGEEIKLALYSPTKGAKELPDIGRTN